MYSLIEKQTQAQPALKRYIHHEKTRNRQTTRQVEVFAAPSNLDPLWKAANCVIKIERSGTRAGKNVKSISYYLCSKSPQSRTLAAGIRGHWLIENRLHWVKDVIFGEDISPIKSGAAPINLSLLKTWVLTLLRIHGFSSLSQAINFNCHNLTELLSICT